MSPDELLAARLGSCLMNAMRDVAGKWRESIAKVVVRTKHVDRPYLNGGLIEIDAWVQFIGAPKSARFKAVASDYLIRDALALNDETMDTIAESIIEDFLNRLEMGEVFGGRPDPMPAIPDEYGSVLPVQWDG